MRVLLLAVPVVVAGCGGDLTCYDYHLCMGDAGAERTNAIEAGPLDVRADVAQDAAADRSDGGDAAPEREEEAPADVETGSERDATSEDAPNCAVANGAYEYTRGNDGDVGVFDCTIHDVALRVQINDGTPVFRTGAGCSNPPPPSISRSADNCTLHVERACPAGFPTYVEQISWSADASRGIGTYTITGTDADGGVTCSGTGPVSYSRVDGG